MQLSHPGQRVVLHQALFDQADAAGEGGLGAAVAQGAAAVGAEAAGHIDGDQSVGALPAAGLQQSAHRPLQRTALADAEQGIEPHGRISRIRGLLQGRNAEPAGMAPVGGSEGFVALERAPDPHGDARQLQLARHHQSVATVVAWPHQHQGAPLLQLPPPGGATQFGRDGQGGLLHQGLHRQPAGEQLLLQRRHLGGTHQQVGAVATRPGEIGHGWVGGCGSMMGRASALSPLVRRAYRFGPFLRPSSPC